MPALRALVASLILATATAQAAQPYVDIEQQLTPEQRRDTGLDTLSATQLELLNRLLREKAEAASSRSDASAAATDSERVAGESRPATAPRDSDAMPRTVPMDLEIRTIKAHLKGRVEGWAPGTEFRLDNGQVWKVLKGEMTLRQPLESPEILVVPGIAGRWFLQVHEDYPKARVYRID
jgi:hypothetical protein